MALALIPVTAENVYLVRFMVDAASQGRAIGRRALALLIDELRAAGHTELGWICNRSRSVRGRP
jgi:GNAT superfamily N-acetyltransferase